MDSEQEINSLKSKIAELEEKLVGASEAKELVLRNEIASIRNEIASIRNENAARLTSAPPAGIFSF
jgi:predicted  nucleic acid-binding Zn-ribbon protein